MPNFSIPLSGLTAESTALSAIANNLSNQNTTGYKATQVLFSDLFYQQLGTTGSGDPIEVGAGTAVQAMPSLFTQGSPTSTGVPTDVAIQGSGFFVVQNTGGTLKLHSSRRFLAGSKQLPGDLERPAGAGIPAGTNGVVSTSGGIGPLQLGAGTLSPPSATTSVQLTTNLDAAGGLGSTYSTPVTIYDSLGNSHTLTYNYTNTGPNTWSYNLSIPQGDVTSGTGTANGTLTFDGGGNLIGTSGGIGTPTYGVQGTPNTGNGTVAELGATAATVAQNVVLTDTGNNQFSVVGLSGSLGTATVGVPFTSGQINFTINAGSTAFATGDTITIPTTPLTLGNVTGISIPAFTDGASSQTLSWNVLNGGVPRRHPGGRTQQHLGDHPKRLRQRHAGELHHRI